MDGTKQIESNVVNFNEFLAKKHKEECMKYLNCGGTKPVLTGKISLAIMESEERFFDS